MPSKNELLLFAGQNFFTNLFTMSKIFGVYILWIFLPVKIHPTVPDAAMAEYSLFAAEVIVSILLIAFIVIYAFRIRHRMKKVSFLIICFFVTLAPVANIIPIQNIIASRYLYLPMMCFSLLAVCFLRKIYESDFSAVSRAFSKNAIIYGTSWLLIIYCFSSYAKCFIWKDGHAFFVELKKYYPKKSWIYRGLGKSYLEKKMYDQALVEFSIAKQLDPDDLIHAENLGLIYLSKGMYKESILEFEYVIKKDPDKKDARLNLCVAFGKSKRYNEAINCFRGFIDTFPNYVGGYYNLSVIYQIVGDSENAEKMKDKAMLIDPAYVAGAEAAGSLRN